MPAGLHLSSAARGRFDRLAGDAARIFGSRLVAVIATSVTQSVVFAESITSGDLEAAGALVETWHHDELDTPLLLTGAEFRRSLDAFSVEYRAMVERHVVIAGRPPFADIVFSPEHLRRACEVQAKGHLIHLRQGWLEAAGREDVLADLVVRSAAPLAALLANVARLHGVANVDRTASAQTGARLAGLEETLVHDVLALEDAPETARQVVGRLPEYLDVSERLWTFVDGWQPPA